MQGGDRERNVVLPLIGRAGGALLATPTPHRLAKVETTGVASNGPPSPTDDRPTGRQGPKPAIAWRDPQKARRRFLR